MLEIRPLTTRTEIEACIRQTIGVFRPDADVVADARHQMRELAAYPEPGKDGRRAAFLDGEMVAGYRLLDRVMRLGSVRLRTACIGAVYTRPEFRNQGLARALMLDAIEFATDNGYDLLLLGGIRHFYTKFGYANIHAVTRCVIDVDELKGIQADGWSTRLATEADAALLRDLYRHFFYPYGGSFERSLAMQRFGLRFLRSTHSIVFALDPAGTPSGYIILDESNRGRSIEVVADSWQAMATLLNFHADFAAEADEPPEAINWRLPPDSFMFDELIRRISLQRVTNHVHHGGWMARVADEEQLARSLIPHWQEKRKEAQNDWSGTVDLTIDNRCWKLAFGGDELRIQASAKPLDDAVILTAQQFIQLCFAYPHPLVAADGAFEHLSSPAKQAISTIFGQTPFWIAGSDGF
jgi:predicted N-acetyltransferase YhbS